MAKAKELIGYLKSLENVRAWSETRETLKEEARILDRIYDLDQKVYQKVHRSSFYEFKDLFCELEG